MTKPFGDPSRATLLVIGHDPRLQNSDATAGYSLYADYYCSPRPISKSEAAKYDLAASVFSFLEFLMGRPVSTEEVVVTNLCNKSLPHAPKGKTVLIPEGEARTGMDDLLRIVKHGSIRLVFPMSEQVNYWLQHLGFYSAKQSFLRDAAPSPAGLQHNPPFYKPRKAGMFPSICGRRFAGPDGVTVFPIVHVKNWPLRGAFLRYQTCLAACSTDVQALVANTGNRRSSTSGNGQDRVCS